MPYPIYTLKYGAVEKPLDDFKNADGSITAGWGLSNIQCELVAHGCDRVTMTAVVSSIEAGSLFAYKSTATIYRCTDQTTGAKVPWFQGVWTSDPANIAQDDESFTYELSGPWWYLTQLPYLQTIKAWVGGVLSDVEVALVVLGQGADLSRIDLATFIQAILNSCIAACAAQTTPIVPFSVSVDLVPLLLMFERLDNMTHEQVLVHCLRWYADSTTWFDYSQTPPVFHIAQRSALAPVSVPAVAPAGETAAGVRIRARNDLVVPGVIIQYLQSVTVDGNTQSQPLIVRSPSGVRQTDLGVLLMTIDLQAGHITFQKNTITVVDLPETGPGAVTQWDKDNAPDIFGAAAALDIAHMAVSASDKQFDPQDTFGPAETGCTLGALVGELKNGAMPPQMIAGQGGAYSENVAYIYFFRTYSYSGTDAKTVAAFQKDRDNPGTITVWYRMAATTASSGTYSWPTSEQDPETPPIGLEEVLYNSNSVLHYEGQHKITDVECASSVSMGNTFNLTGSRAAYATMNAQITGIGYNIDTATCTVKFGPPKNLGIQELLDIYRASRIRRPPIDLTNRSSGDGSGQTIEAHTYTHCTSRVPGPPTTGFRGDGVWGGGITFKKTGASTWQLKITGKSTIGTSPASTDQLAVSGLDTWKDINSADLMIYLQANVASSGGNLTSSNLTLYVGTTGGFDQSAPAWTTNAYIEGDGSEPQNQIYWRLKICDLDWSSGSPVPTNAVNSQLIIRNRTEALEAAIYPTGA